MSSGPVGSGQGVGGQGVGGRAVSAASSGDADHPLLPRGTERRGERADDEARLAGLLRRWWLDERPAWCEVSWWGATLREEVRGVLWLPAGPGLLVALAALPREVVCSLPHGEDRLLALPTPGHAPGWPCACQVVVAAAWEACAAWVAAGCARVLVDAAGVVPVEVDVAGGRHWLADPAREELAAALRWSPASAGNRIEAARALVAHPRLVALVESAAISVWAGRLVCDHLAGLTVEQAGRVVEEVAARVQARLDSGRRALNSAEVNRVARAARMRLYPVADQEARIRAWAQRRVVVHPQGNGMATLIADLADTDAHRIRRRLTSLAAGLVVDADAVGEPETRTRDQLRADVFTDLLLGATRGPRHSHGCGGVDGCDPVATGTTGGGPDCPNVAPSGPDGPPPAAGPAEPGAPPGQAGRAAAAAGMPPRPAPCPGPAGDGSPEPSGPAASGRDPRPVPRCTAPAREGAPAPARAPRPGGGPAPRADIQVLVTLDTLLGHADRPALVPGLGLIPADTARELAADGRWTALITDAAGAITATGTTSYVPSAAVARLVRARDPHCRFPGCRQPATRCDLDHTIPWPRGTTTPDNLGPLCRRHHQLKTHGGWTLHPATEPHHDPPSPGWRWTTPAGLTITDHREPPLP